MRRGSTDPSPGTRIAAMLLLASSAAAGASRPIEPTPLRAYLLARAADMVGDTQVAARGYADLVRALPDDAPLAARAFHQALRAGDVALAEGVARDLSAKPDAPADVSLFLFARAVQGGDWPAARAAADRIEHDRIFSFLAPLLRAWIAAGAHDGDPLAWLKGLPAGGIAAAYAPEQRAYLLLALDKSDDAAAGVAAMRGLPPERETRLRMAVAAALARRGRDAAAAAILQGDTQPLPVARALLARKKPPGAPVVSPADGVAELFVRLAADLDAQHGQPLALDVARMATMLAPRNGQGWLLTAQMLAQAGQPALADAALANVAPEDAFAPTARGAHVRLLIEEGRKDEALAIAAAEAKRADATADDLVRAGDVLSDLGHDREAAAAYGEAAARSSESDGASRQSWQVLLLEGGAFERAGDWDQAHKLLSRAAEQAPHDPMVLNYLGYSELSRRENLAEARALIERASKLKPDDAAITDSLGWAYFVSGDIPTAIKELETAARATPADPTVNEHLGDAYWGAGRAYEARYAWAAALVQADGKDAARLRDKLDTGWSPALAAP